MSALAGGGGACAILLAGLDGVMGTASCGGNYSTAEEDGGCFSSGGHAAELIFHLHVLSEMKELYKWNIRDEINQANYRSSQDGI